MHENCLYESMVSAWIAMFTKHEVNQTKGHGIKVLAFSNQNHPKWLFLLIVWLVIIRL